MSSLGSSGGGVGASESGLTKSAPGLLNLSDTPEWIQANEWNNEGSRLLHAGELEAGMDLLSRSARYGLPWALSSYTWWCLLQGDFARGLREYEACSGACESIVAQLQKEMQYADMASLQLANARSNAALLRVASGGSLDQARDTWVAGAQTGHAESMFYPAVVAEKQGDRAGADAIVRDLRAGTWFDVRQTLREGIEVGGWFAQWCSDGLVVLERNEPSPEGLEIAGIDVAAVLECPRASNEQWRDGLWEAVEAAMNGSVDGEKALREFAEGGDATSWIARLELGTLLSDPDLRPSSASDEGVRLLSLCLRAPYRDVVASAAWNLASNNRFAGQSDVTQALVELAVVLGDGTAMRQTAEQMLESGDDDAAVELLERASQELPPGDLNRARSRAHLARLAAHAIHEPFATWFTDHQGDIPPESWGAQVTVSLFAGGFNVDVAHAAIATGYFEECPAECYFEAAPYDCGDCGRTTTSFLHAASGNGDGGYNAFSLFGPSDSGDMDCIGVFIPFMPEDTSHLQVAARGSQFLDVIASAAPLVLGTLDCQGELTVFDASKSRDDREVSVRLEVPPGDYVVVCWLRPEVSLQAHLSSFDSDPLASVAIAAIRGPLADALLEASGSMATDERDAFLNDLWSDEGRLVAALIGDIRPEVLSLMLEQTEGLEHRDSFLLQLAERPDDGEDARFAVRSSGRVGSQETLDLLGQRGFLEPKLPWWQQEMARDATDIWAAVVEARGDQAPAFGDVASQPVWVRRAVARRADLSAATVEALLRDPDSRVRRNLAASEFVAIETLVALAADSDDSVVGAVAANRRTPQDVLVRLAQQPDPPTGALASNPQTPGNILHLLVPNATRGTRAIIAGRMDLPAALAEHLSRDAQSVRKALAQNEACPSSVLIALSRDENAWIRSCVAANAHVPEAVLMELSLDLDDVVRESVIGNPAAPETARVQASLLGAAARDDEANEPPRAIPPDSPESASMTPARFCPSCDNPVEPTHRFCSSCGAQVPAPTPDSQSLSPWYSLQADWELRGNFNVEGGSAAFGTRIFDSCDCEGESDDGLYCVACGRGSENFISVTAGAGDGVYPVFRLLAENGSRTGIIAIFEQNWAQGAEAKTRRPADIVSAARPVYAGSITVADVVYASEASAGWDTDCALVDIELPPGQYEAIAWQADMEILRENGMQPTMRQIALALYSSEVIQALESILPPDRREKSRIAMSSRSRMFDQVLAHQVRRWADACMYNAREDHERGEEERALSWLLQAAAHGHRPAADSLPPYFLESTAPLDVARRARLLELRGQRPPHVATNQLPPS